MADQVRVTGLKELRRELKALEGAWPRELQKVNKAIAELVAEGTRDKLSYMPGSAPKVVPTVKALAQQMRAVVKVGGGSTIGGIVAMGNIWGAKRYPQFPAHIRGGYALYPTITENHEEITVRYLEMIDDLLKRAFPD